MPKETLEAGMGEGDFEQAQCYAASGCEEQPGGWSPPEQEVYVQEDAGA